MAFIEYTSGSTGAPKSVATVQWRIAHWARWHSFHFPPGSSASSERNGFVSVPRRRLQPVLAPLRALFGLSSTQDLVLADPLDDGQHMCCVAQLAESRHQPAHAVLQKTQAKYAKSLAESHFKGLEVASKHPKV